jgi:MFS family permease
MENNKKPIVLLFLVMLVDVMGFSILIPIAPFAVGRYSPDAIMVTLISFFFAISAFLTAPILGAFGDHYGRRPVLLFCMIGSAIGYMVFGIGGALWVLFLGRIIKGVAGGCISTASAYILDISKPEERAKNMGLIGMAYGFGFIIGPALGGALGQISINAPVFAIAALSVLGAGLVYFFLPESLLLENRVPGHIRLKDINPFRYISSMLFRPGLGIILVIFALINLYYSGVSSTKALFLIHRFGLQPMHIGALFVAAGVATAIVQVTLLGKLVRRFGEKTMAINGLGGLALGGILMAIAPLYWLQFPISFLQAGISCFIWSCLGSLSARQVSKSEQGVLTGVNSAIGGLMGAIGPLLAGAACDNVSLTSPFTFGAIIPLVAMGLVIWKIKGRTVSV